MLPDINEVNDIIFINNLFNWIEIEGKSKYDESVTQYEHCIQTAMIAKNNQSSSSQIVAALLHDIGHLILTENQSKKDFLNCDLKHELIGARWLEKKFPKSVTEPIKLHVPAKRYLCSVDKNYYDKLSTTSKMSLEIQGGPMSIREQKKFKFLSFSNEAIFIRKWDDDAKVKDFSIVSIRNFKSDIVLILNNQ